MTTASGPRGCRPGGFDTRGEILAAARESSAHKGFAGTTIRAVAASAGVDAALVHHYFGSKDDSFIAALEIKAYPRGGAGRLGARPRRRGRAAAAAVPVGVGRPRGRGCLGRRGAYRWGRRGPVNLLREAMFRIVFGPLREVLPAEEADRRARLVATQVLGLIVGRYLLRLEPLAR